MRERLSSAGILWRWIGTPAALAIGASMLRDSRSEGWDAPLAFSIGAALVGWEVYVRLARKTLVLHPGKVEVFRRGVLLGSFDPTKALYYGWISKIKPLLAGIVGSGLLVLTGYTSSGWPGAAMMVAGLASMAGLFYDLLTHWTIACPKWGGRDLSVQRDDVNRKWVWDLGVDVGKWTLTPAKADVVAILGHWPGEPPARLRRAAPAMLAVALVLGLFAAGLASLSNGESGSGDFKWADLAQPAAPGSARVRLDGVLQNQLRVQSVGTGDGSGHLEEYRPMTWFGWAPGEPVEWLVKGVTGAPTAPETTSLRGTVLLVSALPADALAGFRKADVVLSPKVTVVEAVPRTNRRWLNQHYFAVMLGKELCAVFGIVLLAFSLFGLVGGRKDRRKL